MNTRSKKTLNPRSAAFWAVSLLKIAVAFVLLTSAAFAQILTPQGRLTLTSNTPVMTQDVLNTGTVYYTPYVGNALPLPNGSGGYTNSTFSQLGWSSGTALNPHVNIPYDMFAYNNSGTWVLCVGPAWASLTSRGSGSGTTEITQVAGIWVNANALSTCRNNYNALNNSYSVAANAGVYLGSVFIDNSLTATMQFSPAGGAGGTNNLLSLYNAYNRIRVVSTSNDSTANWTYSAASWRFANNSNANRINWLDGLQQSFVNVLYQVQAACSTNNIAYVGIAIDPPSMGTISPIVPYGLLDNVTSATVHAAGFSEPLLGWHNAQAIEESSGGTGTTFYGSGPMALQISVEM